MDREKLFKELTEYMFVETSIEKADVIFIPGNGYPQMSEEAAKLWKEGMAPAIVPSGKYSILAGAFTQALEKKEEYSEICETESEFMSYVLQKNGVSKEAIWEENQATYTYENALFSKKILEKKGVFPKNAILCCKSTHARRCLMYYQMVFPGTKFMVHVSNVEEISKDSWWMTEKGVNEVFGELKRISMQFQGMVEEELKTEEKTS